MRQSLQAIFASGFFVRTGSAEEIIFIADSADFSHKAFHNRRRVGNQLRAALRRHAGDTVFMDALRRKLVAWGLEQPATAYRKSEVLIEVVMTAVARGRLMARILPVGVSHDEAATTSARSIPRESILGQNSFLRRVVSAAASVTLAGQIAQTIQAYETIKSTTEISRMDPIEKIAIVLEGTRSKLADSAVKDFAALLVAIGVTRLAVILAGWAASQAFFIGEVIDVFLGAAFAIGCLLTGWALADGVVKIIDATNDAVDAQNQRDLDAASAKMAKGIETLGVALLSLAAVCGTKTGAGGKVSAKSVSTDSAERVQLVDPEPQKLLPAGPSDRRLLLNPGPTGKQVVPGAGRAMQGSSTKLNQGNHDKHVPGTNNYVPGKSVLTDPDPQGLLDQFGGTGTPLNKVPPGQPGFRERVDFGKVIGDYVSMDGNATPTTNGIIHYGKNGAHIVPSRP